MKKVEMIGMSPDLSPYYSNILQEYIKLTNISIIGKPGKMQGYNSGVVLFHLKKMRENKLYNQYLQSENIRKIMKKYVGVQISTGDQDWFNLVGFTSPELFFPLPCVFNMQTSVQYLYYPQEEKFIKYHYCAEKSQGKIFHFNGCGPRPIDCKNIIQVENESAVMGREIHINVEKFWISMMVVFLQDMSITADGYDLVPYRRH
ncbi:xyloside xylosyltransferase 1 [Eurytemora carolleeae]|uniref:xyloside xylosyltransferase 1 n=1 Tax=Eurytemora carolleeae TaxID=1294199 RepID=UPI000C75D677|nr:xyloside xylosyltransferase 1 [Eurytemora carolleeae]XP_023327702.1 xyloside xylosyltransferase 1 [Eurytemora carolleeae]|eukprot:XP_023327693.1 xyloside xylosyltransferase 1-like [Eurytemora affinis]